MGSKPHVNRAFRTLGSQEVLQPGVLIDEIRGFRLYRGRDVRDVVVTSADRGTKQDAVFKNQIVLIMPSGRIKYWPDRPSYWPDVYNEWAHQTGDEDLMRWIGDRITWRYEDDAAARNYRKSATR